MKRVLAAVSAFVAFSSAAVAQVDSLRVAGAVPRPLMLTAAEIASMPHQTVTVTGRGQSDRYTGVPLSELLKRAGAPSGEAIRGADLAKYVVVSGADGYRVVFALAELDSAFSDRTVLLADRRNDALLPDNARPYQLVVPGEKRPARWVRQVVSVEIAEAPSSR